MSDNHRGGCTCLFGLVRICSPAKEFLCFTLPIVQFKGHEKQRGGVEKPDLWSFLQLGFSAPAPLFPNQSLPRAHFELKVGGPYFPAASHAPTDPSKPSSSSDPHSPPRPQGPCTPILFISKSSLALLSYIRSSLSLPSLSRGSSASPFTASHITMSSRERYSATSHPIEQEGKLESLSLHGLHSLLHERATYIDSKGPSRLSFAFLLDFTENAVYHTPRPEDQNITGWRADTRKKKTYPHQVAI